MAPELKQNSPRSAPVRRPLRITVLCGGPSAEREVSLESGHAVAEALQRRGHNVFVSDIGPDHTAALDHPADVVFPALHGPFGEDGTVQRMLEARRLPFVGSGAQASAVAMDKVLTKQAVARAGVNTPRYEVWDATTLKARTQTELSMPVVVKPADQGSSVATFILRDATEFPAAVQKVVTGFGRALVEQFVSGAEITVGIIGQQTLPPIRIQPKRDFYDYTAKYQDNATEYLFETGQTPEVLARAAEQSLRAFQCLGCRHLSRVDWIVDARGEVWFLEINTLPGFTGHSLVPKAAARAGVPFDELAERLVYMALEDAR